MFEQINMPHARPCNPSGIALFTILVAAIAASINSAAVAEQHGAESADNTARVTNLLYQSSITAAEKALRLHELRDARKWLDHAPETLRGWEWQFLHAQCDESMSSFPIDQPNVTALDVSADGQRVAIATAQGEVTLYSLPDFTDPTKIGEHNEAVYSVAFSDDSTRLVTVSSRCHIASMGRCKWQTTFTNQTG